MKLNSRHSPSGCARGRAGFLSAFTLIEVMIAMGIFFMAVFAILGLVSVNLHNARLLQEAPVDPSAIIAPMWLTNGVTKGSGSGDFGDLYPGYSWESNSIPREDFPTNGIYEVQFIIKGPQVPGGKPIEIHTTVLQWNPNPPVGDTATK